MKILILDDSSTRQKTFRYNLIGHERVDQAMTYHQAVELITNNVYDVIFFDHDLNFENSVSVDENGKELTGADFARYVAELDKSKHPKLAIVHSFNESGSQNIMSILKSVDIECLRQPFSANIKI